jgi:2-polyprenyl-3-methyl-5-hydroxy-6-metoxy-1,4-benzoquinol methylase
VLDYGCGSGYGSNLLAGHAKTVVGMDIQPQIIDHCIKTYSSPNLSFLKKDPNYCLPFEDDSFDVIVSFQVIEHIPKVKNYLLEFNRVLRGGGVLLITTPNKKYRLLPFQMPSNTEHLREYRLGTLEKQLKAVFKNVEIHGVYGRTDEINSIEYKRVKPSILKGYVYHPLRRLLHSALPPHFILTVKKVKRTILKRSAAECPSISSEIVNQYSLDDFVVGTDCRKCLDFLGICTKA